MISRKAEREAMNWRTMDVTPSGNFWQTQIQRAILVREQKKKDSFNFS
jgi:hypothetical protein